MTDLKMPCSRSAAAVSLKPPLPPRVMAVRSAHVTTMSSGEAARMAERPRGMSTSEERRWEETWDRRSWAKRSDLVVSEVVEGAHRWAYPDELDWPWWRRWRRRDTARHGPDRGQKGSMIVYGSIASRVSFEESCMELKPRYRVICMGSVCSCLTLDDHSTSEH